eukprot:scaffold2820_cov77-Attheya_sp.AAC.1
MDESAACFWEDDPNKENGNGHGAAAAECIFEPLFDKPQTLGDCQAKLRGAFMHDPLIVPEVSILVPSFVV